MHKIINHVANGTPHESTANQIIVLKSPANIFPNEFFQVGDLSIDQTISDVNPINTHHDTKQQINTLKQKQHLLKFVLNTHRDFLILQKDLWRF